MNNEQKKTQEYKDQTLEEITPEDLAERNKKLVAKIKDGSIGEKVIAGEIVFKFTQSANLAKVAGKPKLAFEVDVPKFTPEGDPVPLKQGLGKLGT